jgi:LmbE family N-acetylglucosaminyl deacetylase
MRRRSFLEGALSAPLVQSAQSTAESAASSAPGGSPANPNGGTGNSVFIERKSEGKPHGGKVLALITPHLDDGPIFAGGTLCKLLSEGYRGYFIRTTNDEKDSYHLTLGETVLANEQDTALFVKTVGLERSFDLSYRNHRLDEQSPVELRARLIFLFRLLKVDTVFSYDPWGHYEENPDHYVTAQAVQAACWMAAGNLDFPEHFAAGLKPQGVREKYYFARGPQLVNRVVDIEPFAAKKQAAVESCVTMVNHMVQDLNEGLAAKKLKLPAFATGDRAVNNRAFVEAALLARDRDTGRKYGLQRAEEFHYIGPDTSLETYIRNNAVPL